MASLLFDFGDPASLTWTIDLDGTPTNATVSATVDRPDGTTDTLTVSNPATGTYATSYTAPVRGDFHGLWVASGAVVDQDPFTFYVGNFYCTLEDLKSSLGIDADDESEDRALSQAIARASRYIDSYCGTTFYPVTEARTFSATDGYSVWVDDFTDITDLSVSTGTDGTYTTEVDAAAVIPHPLNASRRGSSFYRLMIPTGVLPTSNYYATVEVTATWGWHYVPGPVEEACLLKAAHLYKRKDSPHGIAGTSDLGMIRMSRFEDPDFEMCLAPYKPVVIA